MHVNNETGLIQDIHSFAETCAEQGVAFFTDSTQAIGHIETDYGNPAISMACMSAHKIAGPKGVGVFIKKREISASPILIGGSAGLEAGTQSTSQIVGFNQALTLRHTFLEHNRKSKEKCLIQKQTFLTSLNQLFCKDAKRTIPVDICAPHILHLHNVEKLNLLETYFSLSNGSACQNQLMGESHVAQLLNLDKGTYCRLSMEPSHKPAIQLSDHIREAMKQQILP